MPKNNLKLAQITETKTKVTISRVLIFLMIFTAGTTVFLGFLLFILNLFKTKTILGLRAPSVLFVDSNSPNCQDAPGGGGMANPFCTIQYAVDSPDVVAGSIVYVRKGTYRESINLNKDGLTNSPIFLRNYRQEEVIIDGSVILDNWTPVEGNVYKKSYNSNPYGLFLDNNLLEKVWPFPDIAIVGSLNDYLLDEQWTYDEINHFIYLKLSQPLQQSKIEVPEKTVGINNNNHKFWVIEGLNIVRFKKNGIKTSGSGGCGQDYLTIKNNLIGRNEYAAIEIGWCPGVVIENNTIVKNGLIRDNAYLRHQGVKTSEAWSLYPGSNSIYQTVKGNDCNNGICNAGPEIMYFDGNEVTYNYEARTANNPALLSENEWTTLGPNGEEFPEIYFYPPNGTNPATHQVKRAVFFEIFNGSDIGGHGILINTPDGKIGRFVIKNNQILNNNSKGISVCYTPNYCLESVAGSVIYNNAVYNSGESGVDGGTARSVTFAYNKLWQNGIRDLEDNGLNGHGDKGLLGTSNWRVHHNTIQSSGNVEHGFGHYNARFFHNTLVKDLSPLDPIIGCANYGGQNSYLRPESYDDFKMKNSIFVINGDGNHVDQCGYSATIIGLDPQSGNVTDDVDWNGNDYYTVEPNKTHTIGTKCLTPNQGSQCINNNFMEAYPNEHRTDGVFDALAEDPLFINQSNAELHLQNNSPLIDKGVPLTTTAQGGTNTQTVYAADAKYFHDLDAYPNLPQKEKVKIGSNVCTIIDVDYTLNTITCENPLTYASGDKVYWDYNGQKPDMGAFETGG